MPADQRRNLPDRPGVYRMLRANGDVLYVGKATSLRQRVRSYFQPRARHAEHILEMLSQARELELTVTGSAVEAALEEADAIKQLSPPYNKALRPGERALVFASPTLDRVAGTPDRVHRLGPLAGRDLWKALELLARHDTSASPAEALAVPEAYAPAAPTLAAGVERFRAGLGTSSLLAHGARLWRARIAEREQEDEFRLEMQYDTGVDRWTPERVASALDDLVCGGAHQARRGHWLCLVSEATLVWDGIALEIAGRRVRSRGGPIVERTTAYPDFHERRRGLDLDTYDRLIVLTREIRRLVAEDRAVRLHVGPSTALANEQLKAWFQWI